MLVESHMLPKAWFQKAEAEQALFKEALQNPALAGRMMHNNFMYQDPNDGPSILNVNASILEAEIEYRRQFLEASRRAT